MKTGFVAITGAPNVGKSSLLNKIFDRKIAIVSSKAQTTRNVIKGIYNNDDCQIIFTDSPGFHIVKNKLDAYMNAEVMQSVKGADLILFLSDSTVGELTVEENNLIERIKEKNINAVAVLTKKDLSNDNIIQNKKQVLLKVFNFKDIVCISVNDDKSIQDLLILIKNFLKEGPAYYDTKSHTNYSDKFFIAEIIREKTLSLLKQEVPHAIAVIIDKYNYDESKKLFTIKASIIVEKESQKPIVIGAKGDMIKQIGIQSRQELEVYYNCQVYLELFVKVESNWRNDEQKIKEINKNNL